MTLRCYVCGKIIGEAFFYLASAGVEDDTDGVDRVFMMDAGCVNRLDDCRIQKVMKAQP